ncbi:nucleotidyltransferase [Capnocytophaga gingivalis]|uniref:nucleotidyltransferase n=1 Tax=Capnocytophaga gingivalis TaxID=1017 RepID=UPI0020505CA2|nr:nucleotidyltransferase [Capnocytophaga gingivalis]DAY24762.1 MAG TPA: Baseplate structural protein [Caudoviricetes sp.]
MARTIQEIQTLIYQAKAQEPALNELNSTSKVAIWRLWVYIIAVAIWSLEKIFDIHRADIDKRLAELKPHTARWYRSKALAFQYGFDLLPDSDTFNNQGHTEEAIEASKIVKYSAVIESKNEGRLIVKIATEQGEQLQPITDAQKQAFEAYLQEIKDAGVRLSVVNYQPDILHLQMKIVYDPLVLDSNGQSIIHATKPVETAIKDYLKRLPFNGELVLAHLIDALQQAEGVKIPHLVLAQSKNITSSGDYGAFETIEISKIPTAGYFTIDNFNDIIYTSNV